MRHSATTMACVRKHLPLLQTIQKAKPKLRKEILKNADTSLIKTIIECVHNVLVGNVPLENKNKKKLLRYKNILRSLVKSKSGIKHKKKIIVQSGGAFLPALLVPIVTAAISHFMSK